MKTAYISIVQRPCKLPCVVLLSAQCEVGSQLVVLKHVLPRQIHIQALDRVAFALEFICLKTPHSLWSSYASRIQMLRRLIIVHSGAVHAQRHLCTIVPFVAEKDINLGKKSVSRDVKKTYQ